SNFHPFRRRRRGPPPSASPSAFPPQSFGVPTTSRETKMGRRAGRRRLGALHPAPLQCCRSHRPARGPVMRRLPVGLVGLVLCALLAAGHAHAQNAIQTGAVVVDPPTICCLGFLVPIVSGDRNYNAQAQVAYRQQGTTAWQTGLPLMRVRPELTSTEDPPSGYGLPFPTEGFAGSIFRLAPDTTYEVRITITDPDGGGSEQTVTTRTRAVPGATPATPRQIAVANQAQLTTALSNAMPGDVITLAAGTYAGPPPISRSGTVQNPIIIRGSSRASVIIDATGSTYGVNIGGSNVYVEDLTVQGSDWGAGISNTQGTVIRRSRFTAVNKGI